MISWETIYKYLRFEIPFEKTGLEEVMKNWDLSNGALIPHHNPLLPGELIAGLDKILAGDISFPIFKQWSRIACSSLVDNLNEETGCIENFFYEWENFNDYAAKQNASKKRMIEMIKSLKCNIHENRHYIRAGLSEYEKQIDEFEKKKTHSDKEVSDYLNALTVLANSGDFEARNYIGTMYYSGRMVKQDFAKAKVLYEQASKEGSTQALINLGYIHYYARCGGEPNYELAFNCFLRASKIGDDNETTEALYKLSDMYEKGYYVKRQRSKSFHLVEELYEKELDKYNEDGFSQYLADLAIRLAKAHSKDGVFPDLQKSLHYYYQALYLLKDRWDGKWFGDKKLIDSCNEEIPLLKKELFGDNYDGKGLSIIQIMGMLNRGERGFWFEDLIYDDGRKEIYLYVSCYGLRTIENIAFTGSDLKLCIVIPANRVVLNSAAIENYRYGNGRIELWPIKINDKTTTHRWAISLSFYDDVDAELAKFSSPNENNSYIGYIKDHDYDIAYKDERFSNPKGFDGRYIIKFWIDFGEEFLWSVNEKARAKYGYPIDINELNISDELKKEIKKMCNDHDSYILGEVEDGYKWSDDDRKSFIENVEKPIFEKLKKELGEEYFLIFAEE